MIKSIQIVWFFVGMVIVVAGASFAAFKWSDGITDGQEEIMETVEHINVEQAFFAEDLAEVMDTVHGLDRKFETLQDHQVKQGKAMKRLVWMMENRKEFTPEQWKIIIEDYIEENNTWTPYVSGDTGGEIIFIPID